MILPSGSVTVATQPRIVVGRRRDPAHRVDDLDDLAVGVVGRRRVVAQRVDDDGRADPERQRSSS